MMTMKDGFVFQPVVDGARYNGVIGGVCHLIGALCSFDWRCGYCCMRMLRVLFASCKWLCALLYIDR